MAPNRLADEASPYLRQHADNPVDWYPWGEEAFELARREDKPILLSVGYSACHWCHVMAHESFEDPATAEVMNRLFVNVKVDREERPDVDAIYMDAVQAMAGSGGWPMTVFLFPDGRPFFGGTYFPPRRTHGRPAFTELMTAVDEAWREGREGLEEQAGQLTKVIRAKASGDDEEGEVSGALLDGAYRVLKAAHDDSWGGFGGAPKFPQPTFAELLLRAHARNGSDVTLAMVRRTLDAMAAGGIYDHVGGGFARYAVDNTWTVPHFEKMLYDEAGLLRLYVHGWQVTGDARYRQVAEEIVTYVLRDLWIDGGGIASAEDADSEGVEGKFYVWSLDEVRSIAGQAAVDWYGVTQGGNFEGANILRRAVGDELARPPDVEAGRAALFEVRSTRIRPGLDDKVLTEWNAMFLSALAEAGAALGRADWLARARELAELLLANLRIDGRWHRAWQTTSGARHLAYAADHAWLIDAFTWLAEATGEARWVDEARSAAAELMRRFDDAETGAFFTTADDAEALIARQRDTYDGASPSANSTAALALVRLGALTGDTALSERGEAVLRFLSGAMAAQPAAHTHALAAVDMVVHGIDEIAVVGDLPDLVTAVQSRYLPCAVLAWGEPFGGPLWESRDAGKAYVCRDYACQQPVDSVDALLAQLQQQRP